MYKYFDNIEFSRVCRRLRDYEKITAELKKEYGINTYKSNSGSLMCGYPDRFGYITLECEIKNNEVYTQMF